MGPLALWRKTVSTLPFSNHPSIIGDSGVVINLTFCSSNGITYAESGCFGLGANTAGRVSWEKQLSSEDLNHYTSMKYIDNEGWVDQHPAC